MRRLLLFCFVFLIFPLDSFARVDGSIPSSLTLEEAVQLGLSENPAFRINRLDPDKRSEEVKFQESVFDPTLSTSATLDWDRRDRGADAVTTASDVRTRGDQLTMGYGQMNRDGSRGDWQFSLNGDRRDGRPTEQSVRLGYDFRKPLRRGGGDVNLVPLRLARNALLRSREELDGLAQNLVWRISDAYWDCFLARERIRVYEESLKLSRESLRELQERVKVGKVAETELYLADAEVARRQEDLIDARARAADRRLVLLRLLGAGTNDWEKDLALREKPPKTDRRIPGIADVTAMTLQRRPELSAARRGIEAGELELVRTANGLLPKMDFFIRLGKSGYADSFGSAVNEASTRSFDLTSGLTWSQEPDRRGARARQRLAELTLEEKHLALRNLESLLQLEVLQARNELERSLGLVKATASTQSHRDKVLETEQERYRVGSATSYDVAQAARDRLESRIASLEARISAARARLLLEHRQGILLDRFKVSLEP